MAEEKGVEMKRRSFLKSFVAVPFIPGFLKGWVPADIREEVEEERTRALVDDPMLAAAVGDPLAITVVIPEGRRIKVTGHMHVISEHRAVQPATIMLREAGTNTMLAMTQDAWVDYPVDLHVGVILEPTPGCHTYKLTAAEGTVHAPMLSMIKAEVVP